LTARNPGLREALLAPTTAPAPPDAVRSVFLLREEEELRTAWCRASIRRWRQQSVPHSGVREALLAPMAAPALPDAVRSVFLLREEEELRTAWSRASIPHWRQQSVPHSGDRKKNAGPLILQSTTPRLPGKPITHENFQALRRRRSRASMPRPPTNIAAFGSGMAVMVTKPLPALPVIVPPFTPAAVSL